VVPFTVFLPNSDNVRRKKSILSLDPSLARNKFVSYFVLHYFDQIVGIWGHGELG
jgi:hypothetical protein